MTLLSEVATRLRAAHVPFALIGASALAAHGVSRSTLDQDLLVTDGQVLERAFWVPLPQGAEIDPRRGDADDPLAGVVRITSPGARQVDVVIGRSGWMSAVLRRATMIDLEGIEIPVATAPDLVMLKLYAGGVQDLWDVEQLLHMTRDPDLAAEVERMLPGAPPVCREAWSRLPSRQPPLG